MDNHPIPQDVTNFQFRLIGEMTLKQFGYVGGGLVLAWVCLAAPVFFLLKIFLAGCCVMAGVILAFVPIDGRPADLMVLHFIKALFSPTQFIYQKTPPIVQPTRQQQQVVLPPTPKEEVKKEVAKPEKIQVESFTPVATAAVAARVEAHKSESAPVVAPVQQPSAHLAQQQEDMLKNEVKELTEALTIAKKQETQVTGPTSTEAHEKVGDLEKQLQEIMKQKQELEGQLVSLQKSLTQKRETVYTPSVATEKETTQHVKKISKQMSVGLGAPLVPDVPNLVTGVIKDPRGNVLPNMLIEVKDKDGNPVRAFKTNQLGQFASATPLSNGTYTISFEDPAGKNTFDSVELTTNGEIVMPLEIISIDAREKLRQELFGATA